MTTDSNTPPEEHESIARELTSSDSRQCPVCHNRAQIVTELPEGTRYEHPKASDLGYCYHGDDGTAAVIADFNTLSEALKAPHKLTELKRQSDHWKLELGSAD